jgi:hypothetical protein
MSKSEDNNTNFYSKKNVKKHTKKYVNPNFERHQIKVPFRMLIVGASGSGKTCNAIEVLKRMKDTFDFVFLICKCADEPLYQYLKERLKAQLIVYEIGSGVAIPDPSEIAKGFKKDDQLLVIYDDLVAEKNQKAIEEMFLRGRKLAGGISMMYLTQSFFRVPKLIRLNSNYVLIKKLSNNRDLNLILSEYNLGLKKEGLLDIYKKATDDQLDFLMIRIDEPGDSPLKFTRNFLTSLN